MVKVIWHKAASSPQTDGKIVFARWCQCAVPLEHIVATWRIQLNLCFVQAHPSPQPKRQIDRFSHFCTAHGRVSSGMPGHVLSPNNCSFGWGILAPSNTCFLGPPKSITQTASRSFSRLLHRSRQSVPILYNWPPFPFKITPFHGECWPPSNTWFFGLTRVFNPHANSIGSAVFARLTSVTDRPTDHATQSVTIGRICCVRSTAMRPNNNIVLNNELFVVHYTRCLWTITVSVTN